jgi:1-deoxy-D-xylulose-5-phosphate synthase
MTDGELAVLAAETRDFIINSLAGTGGHLAANLGVAELTCALLAEFDPPRDKIIWDVGHQCYVYKLLTGRRGGFETLRGRGGLSGFPKPDESDYDAFGTGHSSTAVSAALGFAKARDIIGGDERVVAVVGDGAMTGGLAYEGLNNAGRSDTRLIVILNDNQMSISDNVGAISRHINGLRTSPGYIGAKKGVKGFLGRVPVIGGALRRFVKRVKDGARYLLVRGVIFEELGFTYVGPVDGHNISELRAVLRNVRKMDGPVLVHVRTKKGKGFAPAENNPEYYHSVGRFDPETGECERKDAPRFTEAFAGTLARLAERDARVAAITAAMPCGVGLKEFGRRFPERYFDCGIAEGHAVTFAAGLAKGGMKPVFAVYSSFLQRAYDQIVHDVCAQKLPVVFAIDHAGIVGPDGETHQGAFDLSYLSHIPNMTVLAPRHPAELSAMLEFALSLGSPCAVRYPSRADEPGGDVPPVALGEPEVIASGERFAIVSVGAMAEACRAARERLLDEGTRAALISARFVKPINAAFYQKYEVILAVEDNVSSGGFGEGLAAALADMGWRGRVVRAALPDRFVPHGKRSGLLAEYGLSADGVCDLARETFAP